MGDPGQSIQFDFGFEGTEQNGGAVAMKLQHFAALLPAVSKAHGGSNFDAVDEMLRSTLGSFGCPRREFRFF